MSNRLYVGNLSYDLSTEDIKQAFSEVGQVTDAHVMTDRETGRSRGFAFVTMATAELAQQAIREMNGVQLGGRSLRVNEAEERPRNNGGGGGGGGGSYHASSNGGGYGGGPRNGGGGGGGGRNKEPRRGRRDDSHGY